MFISTSKDVQHMLTALLKSDTLNSNLSISDILSSEEIILNSSEYKRIKANKKIFNKINPKRLTQYINNEHISNETKKNSFKLLDKIYTAFTKNAYIKIEDINQLKLMCTELHQQTAGYINISINLENREDFYILDINGKNIAQRNIELPSRDIQTYQEFQQKKNTLIQNAQCYFHRPSMSLYIDFKKDNFQNMKRENHKKVIRKINNLNQEKLIQMFDDNEIKQLIQDTINIYYSMEEVPLKKTSNILETRCLLKVKLIKENNLQQHIITV